MCGPLTVDRVLAPGPHLKAIRSLVTTSEGDNMRVTRYRFYGQFETRIGSSFYILEVFS